MNDWLRDLPSQPLRPPNVNSILFSIFELFMIARLSDFLIREPSGVTETWTPVLFRQYTWKLLVGTAKIDAVGNLGHQSQTSYSLIKSAIGRHHDEIIESSLAGSSPTSLIIVESDF
jgi:hypothetical protein